ncbi:aminoacyl-tRNA deacylase [Melittangium boletus]|uniref:YbaK/aminoacyl-tRNA synthetase-associated domain-containing protein n=1 Tax=Melittangium boletus DSM 14713 TaxID=1294270 RepID=A0A250IIM8_9BACT|nr:YbaK/EbsC family protein [Melittangium boletus]ATB31007.1 hypothetical protein MEBOL_004469 [Melittangium boletus DSM 14713]
MIPEPIQDYLRQKNAQFIPYRHPRAVTAQEVAQALDITGYRMAKSVIIQADEQLWICLIPAPDTLDLDQLRELLGTEEVRLATEEEFTRHFPECETGAEPPFGQLYGLPVLLDENLSAAEDLLFRAGSHEDALEMSVEDFIALESPQVAPLVIDHGYRHVSTPEAMHP